MTNPLEIRYSGNSLTLTPTNSSITLIPYLEGSEYKGSNAKWSVGNTNASYFYTTDGTDNRLIVEPSGSSKDKKTCTITLEVEKDGETYTDSIEVSMQVEADIVINATVSSDYALGDYDDGNRSSVESRLLNQIPGSKSTLDRIVFKNVTTDYGDLSVSRNSNVYADDIADVVFSPKKKGTAVFEFTAYVYTSASSNTTTSYSGLLNIEVTDTVTAKGDIVYSAALGDDVYFDLGHFEDFWAENYPKGTLNYVTFSLPSGGTLKDDSGNVKSTTKYYDEPTKNQDDLSEVYFVPSSTTSKKATTIKVSFTAVGSSSGAASSAREVDGTISIIYLNNSASDITYSTTNGAVTLDPQDFIDAYKEATGKSASSSTTLTVVFQNVPSNGKLTYTNSSKRDINLTSSNVKNYSFSTKSSGNTKISDVTYTGTSGKDTIDYVLYSGGTAQFTGKVVFNATAASADLAIPLTCTSAAGVSLNAATFTSANPTAMAKCSTIRFASPISGSLTYAGVSAVGVSIPFSLLSAVTYTPAATASGTTTDRIVFVAYDSVNNPVASGQINVVVSLPAGSTGSTGSSTPISKMTDVAAGAWYRTELSDLMNKGIISGRTPTTFVPYGTVTYGEALKMVLLAAGYPTQTELTGSAWATNYKNLAVRNGIIEDSIELNAEISRDKMVEVAAKALKISPSSSASPFPDSTNPYAVALYYTYYSGAKGIIGGNEDGTFKGGSTLNRAEMCVIVYRMSAYYTMRNSYTMPDGI